MPSNFPKPCVVCGKLSKNTRCEIHLAEVIERQEARRQLRKEASRQYSGAYKRLAKIVRDNATHCHICKEGPRPGDPWEADHLYPGTPVTSITQLAPAHRSCNGRRGNKPLY